MSRLIPNSLRKFDWDCFVRAKALPRNDMLRFTPDSVTHHYKINANILPTMKLSLKHGLFFGLLVGVFSAFLYAPKAGKELREQLKEKASSVPYHLLNLLESLVDLAVSVLDFAKIAFEEQSDRFSKAVTTGISVAKEKTDELKRYAAKTVSR